MEENSASGGGQLDNEHRQAELIKQLAIKLTKGPTATKEEVNAITSALPTAAARERLQTSF